MVGRTKSSQIFKISVFDQRYASRYLICVRSGMTMSHKKVAGTHLEKAIILCGRAEGFSCIT